MDYWISERWKLGIEWYVRALSSTVKSGKVSFSDNMDEPVHRWYRFPAGFSADLVRRTFKVFGVSINNVVLDPFAGSGTLNVEAMKLGVDSIGVEAHPLLVRISRIKTNWDLDEEKLKHIADRLLGKIAEGFRSGDYKSISVDNTPELLLKVYDRETLQKLYYVKDAIESLDVDEYYREFFWLALLCITRKTTRVDVGWPYILPKKTKRVAQEVYKAFTEQVNMMVSDIRVVKQNAPRKAKAVIYESDARNMKEVEDESVDFIFTSPPYLNNYDYADRTRLELYFLGWCKSWRDITEKVRKKLIIASTTQVSRSSTSITSLSNLIPRDLRDELEKIIVKLGSEKYRHGGKKDYDLMVAGYMNDMSMALKEMARVLKSNKYAVMILGDSAPYGVYIPTHEYLGRIAVNVGFSEYRCVLLRKRGEKWKYIVETGRRHNIKLGEYALILKK